MGFDWEYFQILVVLCVAGIVILSVVISYRQVQARKKNWAELGTQTGMKFEPGGFFESPRLSGIYRQHPLTLETFQRGTGKRRRTYTRIIVELDNPAAVSFKLSDENVFDKVGKAFGMKEIQTGDEAVDKRFIIKSAPESFAVRLFLNSSIRERFLQAKSVNLSVDGNTLTFEQPGVLTKIPYLQFLFDLLVDLAEAVERANQTA